MSAGVYAQEATGYQVPPKEIADLLLAKPTPAVSVDSKGEWMLLSERNSYPTGSPLSVTNGKGRSCSRYAYSYVCQQE